MYRHNIIRVIARQQVASACWAREIGSFRQCRGTTSAVFVLAFRASEGLIEGKQIRITIERSTFHSGKLLLLPGMLPWVRGEKSWLNFGTTRAMARRVTRFHVRN